MSTYQMVVRSTASLCELLELGGLRGRMWNWWLGLYAAPPRKLPPML